MAGEFWEFTPRFVAALHADCWPHLSAERADRTTGECWVCFFRSFCRGILGGGLVDGPILAPAPAATPLTSPPQQPGSTPPGFTSPLAYQPPVAAGFGTGLPGSAAATADHD